MPSLLDSFDEEKAAKSLQPKSALDNFDPDAAARGPASKSLQDRPGMAALEGYGQTATMGYLPHIQAGVESAGDKLAKLLGVGVDEKLRAQGFEVPEKSYVQMRDENIARQRGLDESNPWASLGGKALGVAATSILPGMAASKVAQGAQLGKLGTAAAKLGTLGQAAPGAGVVSRIGHGAMQAGAQAAAYNPGDTEGELNMIQAPDRLVNGAIGTAIGGLMTGAAEGTKYLADKSRMVGRVKNSAQLSADVKDEIDSALGSLDQKYIKPRQEQVKQILAGSEVELNPETLKGISPGLDKYAETLSRKAREGAGTANAAEHFTQQAGLTEAEPVRAVIKGERANKLRQLLDAHADYGAGKPFDNVAVAKGEEAKRVADIMRNKVATARPEIQPVHDQLSQAFNYSGKLRKASAGGPIASIKANPGTDTGSIIDFIDKNAGSKLEKLSNQIESAKHLLIDPENFVKPLQFPNEVRKVVVRGAAAGARGAEAITPTGSGMALREALLEAKRKK
jgi:hypothetical protein